MTKKTRVILFLICVCLFLLVAPAAVFYSEGYRIDLEKKKISQTGAFYFKIYPKSSQVYLTPLDSKYLTGRDGKLAKKADFLFGTAFVDNLLPKKYEVEIKKEGFYPWKKVLEIKEKQVTDAKNIILIPENPKFEIISKDAENFFPSPDEKKIILQYKKEKGFSLEVLDLEKNTKNHLIDGQDILKTEADFLDLKFLPDSRRFLLKFNSGGQLQYFLCDSEVVTMPPTASPVKFLDKEVENIVFVSGYSDQLFFLKKGGLYKGDLRENGIGPPLLSNIISFQIWDRNIYYLDNSGFLFETNLNLGPKLKINKNPFAIKKDFKYKIDVFSDKIFLSQNGVLFLFNQDSDSFEKLFDSVKGLKISPDFKKLVYFSDFEVWLFFLEGEYSQPQKMSGEKLFIARFSEKTKEIFWYSSHYLVFDSGSKIKIAEIDDRDRINIFDLSSFEAPSIFWSQGAKELYILSKGNFYESEKLIR